MNTPLRHMAIAASAGSGKTFQLAHRVLRLLAAGVAPERLCAMTFSRKAAGEIFDAIVLHLVKASRDAAAADRTAAHGGFDSPGPDGFRDLLRTFLDALPRLNIGTLDSFLIGILRAFPAELGVPPDFAVQDGDSTAAAELRLRILRQLFGAGGSDDRAHQAFLDAYKRATFGREEKAVFEQLNRIVDECRDLYREWPTPDTWGNPAAIWPGGETWPRGPVEIPAVRDALLAHGARAGWPGKVQERWTTFLDAAVAFTPFGNWPKDMDYLFTRLVSVLPELRRGAAALKLDRLPCVLDAEACRLALEAMRHVIAAELELRLESTAGLHDVLARFEGAYDAWARRLGAFSFSDAQYLLTEANRLSGGQVMSREPDTDGRLYIDYRLDARLDHWLLDEFQDTSDLQWNAIRNLVDELLQDASGERSFFYVGDVKQAIYGWRGGNPELFGSILATYTPAIDVHDLNVSFRSCPPVLDCVNRVFADVGAAGLPAATGARWAEIWHPHQASPGTAALPGYAAMLEPPIEGTTRTTDAERFGLAAALVRQIDPIRRGLSVALLVRTNAQGRELVDVLRQECPGMPIVHEGHAPLADNPVVAVLLALMRLALHPGDRLAWRHLQMSPLAPDLAALAPPEGLAEPLLRRLQTDGVQAFLRHWGECLHARQPLDPFGLRRFQDLLSAATVFDAGPDRDLAAGLRFLEEQQVSEAATGAAVRVMTIHQSKGLGFDVVILPDLQGRSMDKAREVDLVAIRPPQPAAPDASPWVLRMPRRPVADADPVLQAAWQRQDESASFGELCVLYVALTRAKRALYLVTGFAGKTATALSPSALLKTQLAGDPNAVEGSTTTIAGTPATVLYETGQADWWQAIPMLTEVPHPPAEQVHPPAPEATASRDASPPPSADRRLPSRLERIEPSAQQGQYMGSAARLFERETRDVLAFGTEIHGLFEQLDWLDEFPLDERLATWRARATVGPDILRDVERQFRDCLNDREVADGLRRPTAGTVRLWRELRFDIVLEDGRWVRGIFDRIELRLGVDGRPEHVVITDFKSDRVEDEAAIQRATETHRPQLQLYGRAAARLFGLPPERVALRVLFTRAPRIVPIPPAA